MLDCESIAGTLSIKLEVSSVIFDSNISFGKCYLNLDFRSVESALRFFALFFFLVTKTLAACNITVNKQCYFIKEVFIHHM